MNLNRENKRITQLMLPRYKVKIKNPGQFKIGEIITLQSDGNGGWKAKVGSKSIPEKELSEFPDIYQKLSWADYRTSAELPKYVKSGDGETIMMVKSWGELNGKPMFKTVVSGRTLTVSSLEKTKPATSSEFDNFIRHITNNHTSMRDAIKSTGLSHHALANLLECSRPTLYKRFGDGLWRDSQLETLTRLKLSKIYSKP